MPEGGVPDGLPPVPRVFEILADLLTDADAARAASVGAAPVGSAPLASDPFVLSAEPDLEPLDFLPPGPPEAFAAPDLPSPPGPPDAFADPLPLFLPVPEAAARPAS